jgi:dihydrodipicolinate synthase/N-acetylneuraminate lyase
MRKSSDVAWSGVFPALTTQFSQNGGLDLEAIGRHCSMQIDSGVDGLIVLGSLGENSSLTLEEKVEVLTTAVAVSGGRVPVLAGVAEATTAGGCAFVQRVGALGADGFMLLPPTQYNADRQEALEHLRTIAHASELPIMIYNNPVAYRVDVTPEMFAELVDEPKFVALKESSENPRRITDILSRVGNRYRIFVGIDDLVFESVMLGAVGWVAGLACAFPRESVVLFRLCMQGRLDEARSLYRWFMPLLHLDASPKFVQNIKLAESTTGQGTGYVRPPRLPLVGDERRVVEAIILEALSTRPELPSV